MRTWNVVALCLLFVWGCELPTEPLPAGAVALTPPSIYRSWWTEVEACAGRNSNFDAISWYSVPGATAFRAGSTPNVEGYWQPYQSSITLAGRRLDDSLLGRHEELHAILHTVDHPAEYFVQKCGNLVAQ